jgi:predicted transposase YdaD
MRSPHDVFFRRVFASPPRLAALLASAMPPSVVRRLDLSRLERLPERKVTGRLRALEGDLVVRVPLRGRGPREAFVVVWVEAQARAQRLMPLRGLSYGAAEWQAYVQANPRARALPPVLCVVLHTGPRPWHTPKRLHDLMPALSALGPLAVHVPDVTLFIDDLAAQSMETLEARLLDPMGVAALAAMKHVWSKTPAEGMVAGVQRVLSGPRQRDAAEPALDLEHLVQYYAAAAPHLTQQDLELLPEHLQEVSKMTLAEKWMRQARKEGRKQGLEEGREAGRQEGREAGRQEGREAGRQEGREVGRQEGRLDGQRRVLGKLLRLKFGELDDEAQAWLKAANEQALEAASERVLTAATLGEMIGPDVR